MPAMRAARSSLAASIAVFPLVSLLACGGASAPAPAAATPSGATATAAGADAPGSPGSPAASDPAAANPGPPTTTSALPDGGELQGAKLQEKTASGASTFDAPDAGPGRGPHQQEAGRSPKDIQAIIAAHRDEARACYDRVQQQKYDASLKGNLDITWTIDPTGAVTEVGVDQAKSDIKSTDVSTCIQAIIKGIHFSPSAKGFETRAHYPFNFNPKPRR